MEVELLDEQYGIWKLLKDNDEYYLSLTHIVPATEIVFLIKLNSEEVENLMDRGQDYILELVPICLNQAKGYSHPRHIQDEHLMQRMWDAVKKYVDAK